MTKNKFLAVVFTVLAWVTVPSAVFADIPTSTITCRCEQVGVTAPGTLSKKVPATFNVPANIWITSQIPGNMSVFATLKVAGHTGTCTVTPGPYVAYPKSEVTMPIVYPVTISCPAAAVDPAAELDIKACTPLSYCGTKTIPVDLHT